VVTEIDEVLQAVPVLRIRVSFRYQQVFKHQPDDLAQLAPTAKEIEPAIPPLFGRRGGGRISEKTKKLAAVSGHLGASFPKVGVDDSRPRIHRHNRCQVEGVSLGRQKCADSCPHAHQIRGVDVLSLECGERLPELRPELNLVRQSLSLDVVEHHRKVFGVALARSEAVQQAQGEQRLGGGHLRARSRDVAQDEERGADPASARGLEQQQRRGNEIVAPKRGEAGLCCQAAFVCGRSRVTHDGESAGDLPLREVARGVGFARVKQLVDESAHATAVFRERIGIYARPVGHGRSIRTVSAITISERDQTMECDRGTPERF